MEKISHLRPKKRLLEAELQEEEIAIKPSRGLRLRAEEEDVGVKKHSTDQMVVLQSRSSDLPSGISDPQPTIEVDVATSDDSISQQQPISFGEGPVPGSCRGAEESYKSQTRMILQQNKQTLQTIMRDLKALVASQMIDPSQSKIYAKLIEDHVSMIQRLKDMQ